MSAPFSRAPRRPVNLRIAFSAALPPIMSLPEKRAELFAAADRPNHRDSPNGISEKVLYSLPVPSSTYIIRGLPSVIVPVLSVKSMFMPPAVSIPTSRRTRTFALSIFFILSEHTIAIISGKPSGTATTMTIIPIITELIMSDMTCAVSEKYPAIITGSNCCANTALFKKLIMTIKTADMHPNLLMLAASLASFIDRGLSGICSCASCVSFP